MKIAGLQKNSLVDYAGKVAAVVFTPGCNFNCFYCHNRILLSGGDGINEYECEEVLKLLDKRRGFLDGLVVSGGEPTLQKGLDDFLGEVKNLGYPVKLDTNGSSPGVVEALVEKGLVDYIAMDFKAPYDRYSEICGVPVDISSIKSSVEFLMMGKVEYEFRTTVVPQLGMEDIVEIASSIKGAHLYALQHYRPVTEKAEVLDLRCLQTPHKKQVIENMADRVSKFVGKCIIRGDGGNRHA